jgi:hypothetical protein
MGKNKIVQYYVEGDDEVKFLSVLKTDLRQIIPGKIQKFNVMTEQLSDMRLMTMNLQTVVVLIFDTDRPNRDILHANIKKLKTCPRVREIIIVPQNKNLEDELVRCCDISNAPELLDSKGTHNFKRDFIHTSNLPTKLKEHKFDIKKLWTGQFDDIQNDSDQIKII